MKKTVLALAFLGVFGAFTVGCGGPSCESLCEEQSACEGAGEVDCAKSCADGKADVDETGCNAEYDKYLSCVDGVADICALSLDDCSSEITALGTCYTNFCKDNPDANACQP
ncbi:MAG: hypothetical protein R3B70_01680 [Polyangiaceae bacterium]